MPITRIIDNARNLVSLTCSGKLVKGDIRAAFLEMLDDPAFRQGANILWDFSDAQAHPPTEEEIYDFATMVKGNQARRGSGYKVAMVVNNDLYYGLIRMYQAYSGDLPFELMIFHSMDEAANWLHGTTGE